MVRHKQSGFTLPEMLTVIAIVSILATIAIPSFRSITNTSRVSAEINGLLGDMQYARAEAIKEGQNVSICVSSDGATCLADGNWNKGWIVFSDPNNNVTVDAGETLLRVQRAFTGTDSLHASNDTPAVTFNREGFTRNIGNGVLITLHDATVTSRWTRCLGVSLVGLMATTTYGNAATYGGNCT